MLTDRDIQTVVSVVRYYALTRSSINRLHFPDDDDGRITRKRLQILLQAGLINRTHMQVTNPAQGIPAPVYYPSRDGCAFAAQEGGDERYRKSCWQTPSWQTLYHTVQVAETHILLDQAAVKAEGVTVSEWFGEWDELKPDERLPEKRYRLYTRLNDKIVCVPDAAFLLEKAGHRKAFYVEQDRDTTKNAERVAARKFAGYAMMSDLRGHTRHFPTVTVPDFNVLMIAPTPRRRDALRAAFATKPGAKLWKFASQNELTVDSLLNKPVWYFCEGDAAPLLRPENGNA